MPSLHHNLPPRLTVICQRVWNVVVSCENWGQTRTRGQTKPALALSALCKHAALNNGTLPSSYFSRCQLGGLGCGPQYTGNVWMLTLMLQKLSEKQIYQSNLWKFCHEDTTNLHTKSICISCGSWQPLLALPEHLLASVLCWESFYRKLPTNQSCYGFQMFIRFQLLKFSSCGGTAQLGENRTLSVLE